MGRRRHRHKDRRAFDFGCPWQLGGLWARHLLRNDDGLAQACDRLDDRMRDADPPNTFEKATRTRFWTQVLTAGAWHLRSCPPALTLALTLAPVWSPYAGRFVFCAVTAVNAGIRGVFYGRSEGVWYFAVAVLSAAIVGPCAPCAIEFGARLPCRLVSGMGKTRRRERHSAIKWALFDAIGGALMGIWFTQLLWRIRSTLRRCAGCSGVI